MQVQDSRNIVDPQRGNVLGVKETQDSLAQDSVQQLSLFHGVPADMKFESDALNPQPLEVRPAAAAATEPESPTPTIGVATAIDEAATIEDTSGETIAANPTEPVPMHDPVHGIVESIEEAATIEDTTGETIAANPTEPLSVHDPVHSIVEPIEEAATIEDTSGETIAANPTEPAPVHDTVQGAVESIDAAVVAPAAITPVVALPLGQRLRAAREARGWSCEDVGSRLRLPVQVVRTLETGDYSSVPYRIYLRGYLTSYTRLLDLPTILVDNVLREFGETPTLVTTGTVSRSRYLFERYSVSGLYLILTGVIVVPAVLLAMRTTFEPNLAQFAPLDAPLPTTTVELAPAHAKNEATSPSETPVKPIASTGAAPADSEAKTVSPLIASLAPFPSLPQSPPAPPSEPISAPPAASNNAHNVRLTLREASWVEIRGPDGQRLEYGLLPAGAVRSYSSAKPLDVRLGNSNAAEIEVDGQAQDIAPYRYANVAHFKLFASDQAIISRSE